MQWALAAALAAATPNESYDALVSEGVARGRAGDVAEAATLFDRAIALAPERPEARVERGGLLFIEKRYDAAAAELRRALRLREDAYTRDLLGTALQLAGRSDQALAVWNVAGRPTLGTLSIRGLRRTRDRVARRELRLEEGSPLTLGGIRESRLRLLEVGVFDRIAVRAKPLGSGVADVEVALVERHGLARGWLDFVANAGVDAVQQRVRLRYANLAGEGIAIGVERRWETNRPETSGTIAWPRPLGLDAVLRLRAFDGRQAFELEGERFDRKAYGVELGLRRVFGSASVGQLAFRSAQRTFSTTDVAPGRVAGLDLGVERRVLDRHRLRADVALHGFFSGPSLGSDESFSSGLIRAKAFYSLAPPDDAFRSPSVLALQTVLGRGSEGMPIDQAFAAGGSPQMEFPLRAHRQAEDGVFGRTPLGRSLSLVNLEWRRRLLAKAGVRLDWVLSYDGALIQEPGRTVLHDVGLGLRADLPGAGRLRLEYGFGLKDRANAIFLGFDDTF